MENEVLHQILGELQSMNGRLTNLEQGQMSLQNEVNELKTTTNELKATTNELKATTNELKETTDLLRISVLNIELVEMPKIQAALDGVVGNAEKIADHEKRITRLEYA